MVNSAKKQIAYMLIDVHTVSDILADICKKFTYHGLSNIQHAMSSELYDIETHARAAIYDQLREMS